MSKPTSPLDLKTEEILAQSRALRRRLRMIMLMKKIREHTMPSASFGHLIEFNKLERERREEQYQESMKALVEIEQNIQQQQQPLQSIDLEELPSFDLEQDIPDEACAENSNENNTEDSFDRECPPLAQLLD